MDFVGITFVRVEHDTCAGADEGKVGDDLLGVLSLSSTRLTSDCG